MALVTSPSALRTPLKPPLLLLVIPTWVSPLTPERFSYIGEMDDWTAEQLRRKEEDESIMTLLDRRRPDFAAALAKAFSQHREDTHVQEEHQTSSIEEMCDIQDLRFLTRIAKELDFKMGPLEHIAPRSLSHECNETECTLRRTDEEEIQALTKEAEIQVQASQEGSSSKAEAEIQGQTIVGKIVDKLDEAEIQVQTSQECLSDKPEIEIQGQTTVEQIVDKLEEGVEMQNARESVSDKSQEDSQEPVDDDKQDTEIGVEPVQKPTNVEPISDNQDTEIQLRSTELISDEPNISKNQVLKIQQVITRRRISNCKLLKNQLVINRK